MRKRNWLALIPLLVMVSTASAVIDWAGAIWPLSGSSHPSNGDIDVYVRLQKAGVTDSPGQGMGISATLYYKSETDVDYESVVATYYTDYGTDDEHVATIPMAALDEELMYFYYVAYDSTDQSYYYDITDQNMVVLNETTPGTLTIVPATSETFIFDVCVNMNCEQDVIGAGISGSFNDWTFQALSDDDLDGIWCGTVVIPVGSPPHFEYKFRKGIDGNAEWEATANRPYDIPPGSTGDSVVHWWEDFDCTGENQDLDVTFRVDMQCVDVPLDVVSVQGDTSPLDWTAGSNPCLDPDLDDVYETTLNFVWPEGEDLTIQYKFNYLEQDSTEYIWELGWDTRELIIPDGTTDPILLDVVLFNNEECGYTTVDIEVTFQVDMQCYNPAEYAGGVFLRGGVPPLDWDPGITMDDPEPDAVYTATVVFLAGSPIHVEYKYVYSPDGLAFNWENISNRILLLDDNEPEVVLPVVFFDDWDCSMTTVDIEVTFQIDMTCLDPANYAGGVSIQGGTAPLPFWTPGELLLTDPEVDGVYTTVVTFPAGTSPLLVEYKYAHSPNGVDWYWEGSIPNRELVLNDLEPTVILDPVLWDNWLCPPAIVISIETAPDPPYQPLNTHLNWDPIPTATSYTIYGSDDPFFTPDPGNLLDTTIYNFWIVAYSGGNYFYIVTANN